MKNPAQRKRAVLLARLRRLRAQGRPEKVKIGARLLDMMKKGQLTQPEFDYVMGVAPKKSRE